jgi:phosphatidylglycerophosphate synthase
MFDPFFVRLLKNPLDRGAEVLAVRGIRADTVTWVGFGLGLLGAVAIAGGFIFIGMILLAFNRLADGLDGALARATRPSDYGAYLDIVLDFMIYSAAAGGFALAAPENTVAGVVLMISFMGTGAAFLAFAVIAAKRGIGSDARGAKSFFYVGGLTEGSETIAFFFIVCVWPHLFPFAAWIFAALSWVTIAQRVMQARELFRD